VTIHRGTAGGGGVTTIGDRNLFMNYVHVAHDCHVGNQTIFGPHATLGGHVTIDHFVNVSAGSAVHQFCRVGAYAFIGGYSVITKDALPYGRTVGARPARVFGLNLIGLKRRGFADDTLKKLRQAYRYLTQSKLNTTQAVEKIAAIHRCKCPEVDNLVDFIRTASAGCDSSSRRKEDRRFAKNEDRADRGQRPFSVSGARCRSIARPRRRRHRDQGRGGQGSCGGGGARASADSFRLDRAARHVPEDPERRKHHAGGDGRPGQAHQDLRRLRAGLTAMSLMGRSRAMNTDALIGAVADLMRERGVELVNSREVPRADARR
jgi:UDP-N-acetylglucosamine acyltransferase